MAQLKILRKSHKWLGLIMLLPFAVWTVTGLLFALKPGWGPAYEYLRPWQSLGDESGALLGMAEFAKSKAGANAISIELHGSAIGPLYKVVHGEDAGETSLHSAIDGKRLDPLTLEHAQALVDAAISKSIDSERYGVVKSHDRSDTEIKFMYSNGPRVTINLHSAGIRQKGPDTDRINWLYKLHYLQWTGNKLFDRILGFSFIVLVWFLAGAGIVLAWRSRRHASDA